MNWSLVLKNLWGKLNDWEEDKIRKANEENPKEEVGWILPTIQEDGAESVCAEGVCGFETQGEIGGSFRRGIGDFGQFWKIRGADQSFATAVG